MPETRSKVLISGYYGFDNLGDEAILEEICNELKQLCSPDDIYVLSANPELTTKRYGVRALSRNNLLKIWSLLKTSRLLVSGGGGLFQNSRNLASILFYGLNIAIAKIVGCKVMIYAQGIGPLQGVAAQGLTKQFFRMADLVSVRDDASMKLLSDWGVNGQRTADPVWSLDESSLPSAVMEAISLLATQPLTERPFVALSLRPSGSLGQKHLMVLADAIVDFVDPELVVLLVPLQKEQDLPLLLSFQKLLSERGRVSHILDTDGIEKPSQWLALFSYCRVVVAMRLHALILALKKAVPVAGIAYDPKVSQLLTEFEQPILILRKECDDTQWRQSVESLVNKSDSLSKTAKTRSDLAKKLSCGNFQLLAKILGMPRDC